MVYNIFLMTTLLQTKLYIPPLRLHHVPRPVLVRRLQDGLLRGCSLTLISAPAGYGKSTLLAEWLQALHLPVGWLSLDENDNEPARFFAYLLAALNKVDETLGEPVSRRLQGPEMPPWTVLMSGLINDIAATAVPAGESNPRFLLILDDFQAITSPSILEALDLLLAQQPPQLHLILLTRQDPPLALSRLRGRGLISELRQNDLRFTLAEAGQFLENSLGFAPSPAEMAALEERTEGWVAGLQLAALSMQGLDPAGRAQFIANFSGRTHFVLDYLTDEVLKRQTETGQQFLLQTAVLEQMCAPLCDTVLDLGQNDIGRVAPAGTSQARLEELEHGNLFLVPMDDQRHWYRYHRLFVELLRARLFEKWPEKVPELHCRAAEWYEKNNFMAPAVDHALLAGNMDAAAGLVERAIKRFATWSKVEVATLTGWLDALPEETTVSRPWLRLYAARAYYLSGRPEASRRVQLALQAWLEANPEAADARLVGGLLRADQASYAVVRGDLSESIQYARSALGHLPEEDYAGRLRALAILGLAQTRAGDVVAAEQIFSEAISLALIMDLPLAAVPLLCNLAESQFQAGRLGRATQSCLRALQLGAVDGPPLAVTGFAHLELGKIRLQQNDLPAAEEHLATALVLISQGGITESFGNVHGELALSKQALGKTVEARDLARQGVRVAREGHINRLLTLAQAYQARIWLAQGAREKAIAWAQEYQQLPPAEHLRDIEDMALARVLLATGQPAEALALLETMLSPAETAGRFGRVIEIAALRGLTLQILGDNQAALRAISKSLLLAVTEGISRVYLDEGQVMVDLLRQAGRQGTTPEFVGQLLATFESKTAAAASVGKPTPAARPATLVEPLTARELDVLQLLAEGLTNREIAGRLFLSANTVRSHTYHLYGKLGVHSRLQAVTRAREMKLLP